jgi:hypothetical protein
MHKMRLMVVINTITLHIAWRGLTKTFNNVVKFRSMKTA